MAKKSNEIPKLFEKRMYLISDISQENSEYMRLLQIRSGNEFMWMKNPCAAKVSKAKLDAEEQLENCQARIDTLDLDLAQIDKQIETASQMEE